MSFADCGELIAGRPGKYFMGVCHVLILLFIMAAHVLSFAIAMNVLTEHAACTVAFTTAGLVVCFLLNCMYLPRHTRCRQSLTLYFDIQCLVP